MRVLAASVVFMVVALAWSVVASAQQAVTVYGSDGSMHVYSIQRMPGGNTATILDMTTLESQTVTGLNSGRRGNVGIGLDVGVPLGKTGHSHHRNNMRMIFNDDE